MSGLSLGFFDSIQAGFRFAADLEAGARLEQGAQNVTHRLPVIRNQDTFAHFFPWFSVAE